MSSPPAPAADRPDHVDAARALFLTFLTVGAAWGASTLVGGLSEDALSLVMQAAFFLVPLAYARAVKLPPFRSSGYAPLGWRRAALVLLASLGSMWLLQGLWGLAFDLLRWAGYEQEVRREIESLDRSIEQTKSAGALFAAFLFVVASPLCEETLFRGLAFRGFARRYGVAWSLAITTVVFAALHGRWPQRGMMLVLGSYFGLLVWLTGSIWSGVLAHAANNLAVLVLSERYGSKVGGLTAPWWMYPLSAVVFAGAILLLALDRPGRDATSA